MNHFLYDEIEREEYPSGMRYSCAGEESSDLLTLLRYIGDEGWELIGEVEGRLFVKKKED